MSIFIYFVFEYPHGNYEARSAADLRIDIDLRIDSCRDFPTATTRIDPGSLLFQGISISRFPDRASYSGQNIKVASHSFARTRPLVSLLKFVQTCVQNEVKNFGHWHIFSDRTFCFRHKKCSFCQSKTDKQQASIVVFKFLAAK